MLGFERVVIMGNLGNDPEMRFLPNGTPVTNFSVAVNKKYTDNDGVDHESVKWFRVSAWRRQAEVCNEYLSKGSAVYIEGEVKVDPETGNPRVYKRNDGEAASSLELTARFVRFLGGSNGEGYAPTDEEVPAEADEEDDEKIPF